MNTLLNFIDALLQILIWSLICLNRWRNNIRHIVRVKPVLFDVNCQQLNHFVNLFDFIEIDEGLFSILVFLSTKVNYQVLHFFMVRKDHP